MSKSNIQIKTSTKKGVKKAKVLLTDELNIYTIEGIKEEIINIVKRYDEIEFSTKDVKNMDITFVQLFYSIITSVKDKGKKVTFDIKLPEENQVLFDNTDLTRIIKNN